MIKLLVLKNKIELFDQVVQTVWIEQMFFNQKFQKNLLKKYFYKKK